MYSVYLFAAIGIIAGLWGTRKFSIGVKVIGTVFTGIGYSLIGLGVGVAVSLATLNHKVVQGPETMVSFRTTIGGVTGIFITGTGKIPGEASYNFMIKQQDGSIRPASVPANSLVAIIEDESLTNVGYWTTTRREANPSSALHKWGFGSFSAVVRHEFRVPIGTVVQTFKIQ